MSVRCEEAREAMLTAAPPELAGDGTSALSNHLAGCPACRRRAAVLLDGQSELARALDAMSSRDADGRDADREAADGARGGEQSSDAPERRLRVAAGVTGAVLAAAAVLLVWTTPELLPPGGGTGDAVVVVGDRDGPSTFGVDVPPDGGTAVIQTGDPRFVVVWQYDPSD